MTVDSIIQLANMLVILFVAYLGRNKLQELHISLNSRLDELLASREQAGVDKEKAAQADRVKEQQLGAAGKGDPPL